MTTAAICASRELSWRPSFYRGEQFDADLGLYYLRARYYNPQTGRFLSCDPEDGTPYGPKSLHKYLYAGGDPTNGIDPTGRAEYIESVFTRELISSPLETNTELLGKSVTRAICTVIKRLANIAWPGGMPGPGGMWMWPWKPLAFLCSGFGF